MNAMIHPDPIDHEVVISALRDAMQRQAGASWDDLNIESMAVLAQGRGDELPPRERALLLKRIASDPDLGRLLKELRADIGDTIARPAIFVPRTAIRLAWAACLVALVTVGVIRLGDTPTTRTVEILDSGSGQAVFLDELQESNGSTLSTLAGDPIFVSLLVGVVLLGAGAFWPRRSSNS
ncbi:MAG: hypothetical protein VX527_02460 [Planctomycetota bacterium]|nr:hypothetical protein [Planctomycetota bacterium]